MIEFAVACIVGIVLIVLGIFNMRGNISSLHSYHRKRVSEEDKLPFGRMVGLGIIIIGVSIIIGIALCTVTEYTQIQAFETVGMGILIAGLVVGTALAFFAMIKYNKGIF